MVGPAVLTFVKEMGEFFGSQSEILVLSIVWKQLIYQARGWNSLKAHISGKEIRDMHRPISLDMIKPIARLSG